MMLSPTILATKQTVFVWDSEAERAARIGNQLQSSEKFAVVFDPTDRFENLEMCCQHPNTVFVIMALPVSGALGERATVDQILRFIQRFGEKVPIVVYYSIDVTPQIHSQVLLAGAKMVVDEAADHAVLSAVLQIVEQLEHELAEHQQLITRLAALNIAGKSRAWLKVMASVLNASRNREVPVLLTGRTGTGKELVARALHKLNEQCAHKAFGAVNCGAFMGDLVRSELFGHRKGAFTGADKDHAGVFERAQGGTLFLDEIQELDLKTQGMLLRAIQEQRICPVGSNQEIEVKDVRIIAATNQPIDLLVKSGRFREDLFYRLNVIRITLPELAERPEDITPLTYHFLKKHKTGRNITIDPLVMAAFQRAPWRGNARELENVIRATLLAKQGEGVIRMENLPFDFLRQVSELAADDPDGSTLKAALNTVQSQDHFLLTQVPTRDEAYELLDAWLASQALKESGGNQSVAAKRLRMTRGCLRRIIRQSGIYIHPLISMNGDEE